MALSVAHLDISISGAPLLRDVSFSVAKGEIVTLMGASGAGKSTLLSVIAGDPPLGVTAHGSVTLDGVELAGVAPERRGIGRLFQDDLLFPHLTVGENLLFGMARGPHATRIAAMQSALADAGLEGFADRAPHTLSGGQRARVALMRTLLASPRAVLLDEPFSRLDADLKRAIRHFVFERLGKRGIPCLMVTHDRADASDGGRVLKLSEGRISDD
jgi:putative thiamine transport system ATP-binding protein